MRLVATPGWILLFSAVSACAPQSRTVQAEREPDRIFVVGDSTAAVTFPASYPEMGWAMLLKCAFNSDVIVYDYAKSGRSSRSFINEGLFDEVARQLRPGDTLLIQFGHNDEKREDPTRFTDPATDFRSFLMRYVDTARGKSAQPVLLTPVARRRFEAGELQDTHGEYSRAVREVAAQSKTPLIDLGADSMSWLRAAGEQPSKKYFLHYTANDRLAHYPNGVEDNTHFSEIGARAVANLVAARLATLELPISRKVKSIRPALTRTAPTGAPTCD